MHLLRKGLSGLTYPFALAFLAVSIVTAFLSDYALSMVSLAAGLCAFVLWKHSTSANKPRASVNINLIDKLLQCQSSGRPITVALAEAAEENTPFSKELARGLRMYAGGIRAERAFSGVRALNEELSDIFDVLEDALERGADPAPPLNRIRARVEQRQSVRLRTQAQFSNASYINKLGSSVFFPLFCGMGMQILISSVQPGSSVADSANSIAIVLAGFIIISNYISSVLPEGKLKEGAAGFLALSSLGITVFRVSAILALNFI